MVLREQRNFDMRSMTQEYFSNDRINHPEMHVVDQRGKMEILLLENMN